MADFKKNNPGCNCCETDPCPICEMNAGNPSGCGWTVESGTEGVNVTIGSNLLTLAVDNAIVTANADADASVIEQRVSVVINAEDTGDEARLFLKWSNSSNYIYLQVAIGSTGSSRIIQVAGGTPTELVCLPTITAADTPYTLTLCYGNGRVVGSVGSRYLSAVLATTIDNQQSAGVAVGNITTNVEFSDFVYEHGKSEDLPDCTDCGGETCLVTDDAFTRTDGSDIGCAIEEVSGAWDITSNQLRCTTAGVAAWRNEHPDDTFTMKVTSDFKHSGSGSYVYIIVGYVDASNYFYARFKLGASEISIRSAAGGELAIIAYPLSTSTTYEGMVCVNEDGDITASIGGVGTILTAYATGISGTRGGLGASGAGTATFDDFSFVRTYDAADAPDCDVCDLQPPVVCLDCLESEYEALDIESVVAGFLNDSCTDCTSLNGTFVLSYRSSYISGTFPTRFHVCDWNYLFPSDLCMNLDEYRCTIAYHEGDDTTRIDFDAFSNGVLVRTLKHETTSGRLACTMSGNTLASGGPFWGFGECKNVPAPTFSVSFV